MVAHNWLDSLLNVLVPLAIFGFFGIKIYEGLQEPIDTFVAWVSKQFQEEEVEDPYMDREIVFRP